jgi:hypothetical protein
MFLDTDVRYMFIYKVVSWNSDTLDLYSEGGQF